MLDLSHWDQVGEFSGVQLTSLIHGQDPNNILVANSPDLPLTDQPLIATYTRIKRSYERTRLYLSNAMNPPENFENAILDDPLISSQLKYEMACSTLDDDRPFIAWLLDDSRSRFELQLFTRAVSIEWLERVGQLSVYQFKAVTSSPGADSITQEEFDPSDRPLELDYANQAYRAVLNGYGESEKLTFKARVVKFLQMTYGRTPENPYGLTPDAIKRIAIVANPNKASGRPPKR